MSLYHKALCFAARKHANQKRNNGQPYIIHPIRVSQLVTDEDEKAVALLHDTIEDTETTYEELQEEFGEWIAGAVEALTHRKGESYIEYMGRVLQHPAARAVKKADIADNLSDNPSANAIKKSSYGITMLMAHK